METSRLVSGILEQPQLAHLSSDIPHVVRTIGSFAAHEHPPTALASRDLPVGLPFRNGHSGGGDALNHRSHAGVMTASGGGWRTRRRSSAGGLRRVSSRCRGSTLPSALSIDVLTPG